MNPLLIIGVLSIILASFTGYLIIESLIHNRRINRIPKRISVTGTRGKTSVTRLAASMIRESGMKVLAKTTGTEPMLIYPDGSEHVINRVGQTNILEQKRLIRKAVKMGVDCLITEIMSIHTENHHIESQKLIRPNHTIITNFHPDHMDAADNLDMVSIYSKDVANGSNIYAPCGDDVDELKKLKNGNISVHEINGTDYRDINMQLAGAVATDLGCDNDAIRRGVKNHRMDRGELQAWRIIKNGKEAVFVNSFAANDPISASENIRIIKKHKEFNGYMQIGLINLRKDRADRSIQWIEFLKENDGKLFDELYVAGIHGRAFCKKLGRGKVINTKFSMRITNTIISNCTEPALVYGLANIGDLGLQLVKHWENEGIKAMII